jgi:hypothetical protein
MSLKNICFINITVNNNKHNISLDTMVEKKKLYCYERLTSIEYELGHMSNNEYLIDKKIKKILVKPRCAIFINDQDISVSKGIDPEKLLLKLLNHLKKINIIICNNAKFTINSILAESVRYNIAFDFNKFLIIDLLDDNINNIDILKESFFQKIIS